MGQSITMDTAKTRTYTGASAKSSDKNREITILLLSFVMLWALGVTTLFNLPTVPLFSTRFTTRGFVDSADNISAMYALNTNVTRDDIDMLRIASLSLGMCYPVQYDGYLQWTEEQISPLCHCLNKKHHEYEVNFTRSTGPGLPLTQAELTADATGRLLFGLGIKRDCFKGLRPTQYEHLSEWSHNIIVGAILWNTLSTMSVLFTCVAKTDYHKIFSNMYIRVIVEVVLLFWPLLVMISAPSLQVVVTILVSLVSYTVKAFAETRKETWEFHFNMAFWGQFFFTFPMILMSANVVTQQRDGLLNMLVYCIGVCVSLNALSGDYCMAVASRANKPALDGSYKTILFFSWLNNALLILTIFNISSSTFPSNPFSNTASGMWAVTSIVCIIPILQPRSVWRSEDRWSRLIANRYSLDLVARIIYTIAVMIDLSATGYVDNVVIGSPLEH